MLHAHSFADFTPIHLLWCHVLACYCMWRGQRVLETCMHPLLSFSSLGLFMLFQNYSIPLFLECGIARSSFSMLNHTTLSFLFASGFYFSRTLVSVGIRKQKQRLANTTHIFTDPTVIDTFVSAFINTFLTATSPHIRDNKNNDRQILHIVICYHYCHSYLIFFCRFIILSLTSF